MKNKMENSCGQIFLSYWQAGHEGADHINSAGHHLSMNDLTPHTHKAYEDYALLQEFGIRTVRESIGWRSVKREGHFDFSSVEA